MRDEGIPDNQVMRGLDRFAGLAKQAVGKLVSVREQECAEVKQEHLDHFMHVLTQDSAVDPAWILESMSARHISATAVVFRYVPEAARRLGEGWMADKVSFVDVTVCTERLHQVVRRVDESLPEAFPDQSASVLILVAEAEQHTLGAMVLATELRAAGFGAVVRVAPVASELTVLLAGSRFDLALVSIGCTAALESGVGLVKTLRLLSRDSMCIFVGGAIPVPDETLLKATGADRVLRDVSSIRTEFDACRNGRQLERQGKRGQSMHTNSF
ncbi:cobalamin B12-binding domain-containing protein [Tabrizicola sp.]|uniref:cobalamin B12-binding domain-containing protein n=1 Tax=Tabrizicola sp. TaxID=2005166 RepID=UPI003F2FF19E